MMPAPLMGFVGMTHLGLVSGVAAAEKGFQVLMFDPDQARIFPLLQGKLPVSEPLLDTMLERNQHRLRFSSDLQDLTGCDVVVVAPDVTTDDQGGSDLGHLNALLDCAFEHARQDAVLVLLSQVPPGFTRSKQRVGRTLYYQVETLIFGRAVERALHPERYIVGCADPAVPLITPYQQFLKSHDCPILPMRFESAELAKIAINMCLVSSVSVANTLAELCESLGADWREIMPALKLDRRIGAHAYLTPGLGIAGGNLERDLATFCNYADRFGTDAGVVRAWIANSQHRRNWVMKVLNGAMLAQRHLPVIAVLGLAYKQDTHSIKNSPAIALLEKLQEVSVRVFDPVVASNVVSHPSCYAAGSALDACTGADAVVIMTPWSQFAQLAPAEIAQAMRGNLLLDPYAVLNELACVHADIDYRTLGRPPLAPLVPK